MKQIFFVFVFLLVGCSSLEKYIPIPSNYYQEDKTVNLYAFIGKKLSIKEFDPNEPMNYRTVYDSIARDSIRIERFIMDLGFECSYEVITSVFNELDRSTVNFRAYDHYGEPAFKQYKYVLMYISMSSDSSGYFHQKYQFDPLKKGKSGEWTGLKGESIQSLFQKKKETVFTARELFH